MIRIEKYMTKSLAERQKHICLSEPCLERGGMSTYYKGLLAHVLDTTIPSGMKIQVCHYCGNKKCSNVNHLYFGTPKENYADSKRHGTASTGWDNLIKKYGEENARMMIKKVFDENRHLGTAASPVTKKGKRKHND